MYSGWYIRYNNLHNKDGKTLKEMLSEIYVLPIIADPTKEDSDGDGIKDDKEVVWDGIDERYKDIDPLHEDTIETLFPELTENGYNNRANATYISVDGNDVVLHVKAYFTGDADAKAFDVLKSKNLSLKYQTEVNDILARLGEECTLKDLVIDGVKSRWEGTYIGKLYDFHEGLDVNFYIDFIEDLNPEVGERTIKINVKNGVCGQSVHNTLMWKTNSSKRITIYTSYCDIASHKNKDGRDCAQYISQHYDIATYSGTIAHEFGHAFGLKDMYASAKYNHGYEPISNDEIIHNKKYFGLPVGNGIMKCNGRAVANDIEMVIMAFCENDWQYYVPYGKKQITSKAIKGETLFYNNSDKENNYIWNSSMHQFEIQ